MRHYPRHVGDFVSATVGLSLAERGAYSALLDRYYADEMPLPLNKAECYRAAGAANAAERKAVDYVLGRYFTEESDGYHNKRADAELAAYREKSAKASGSASVRWSKRNANAMRTHSEGNANQEPVTSNQEEPTSNREIAERAASPPTTKRATRLKADWQLPRAWGEWAQSERGWPADEVRRVAALFADHWRGKGEARADWEATWRNWVRRERGTATGPPRSSDAKTDARNAFASAILGDVSHEQPADPRDITAEVVRVA